MERSQFSQPILVTQGMSHKAKPLSRVRLGNGVFDEAWLQGLIQEHPECLPIDEIEPAFEALIPICAELPTKHGYVDNLFLTPAGEIVIAEVKLWRNAEMRRKVVAQALDYASSLFAMDYETLEQLVLSARSVDPAPDRHSKPKSLYDLVSGPGTLREAEFIDAVNSNLRRGRAIILVVGDGIRSETRQLFSLLESHAGLHFTFALVEMAVFQGEGGDFFLCPRTLVQTEMMRRVVFEVRDDSGAITPSDARLYRPSETEKRSPRPAVGSISAEQFWEAMADLDAETSEQLLSFIESVEAIGVEAEFQRSLILRWTTPAGNSINLGYVQRDGQVWTSDVHRKVKGPAANAYVERLADGVGQSVATLPSTGDTYVGDRTGGALKVTSLKGHFDVWLEAIKSLMLSVRRSQDIDN